MLIRAASVASVSEAEFVRRVRDSGVAIWPRTRTAAGVVAGYAVEAVIGSGVSRTDIELGSDLALPVLWHDWDRGPRAVAAAQSEWRGLRSSRPHDRHRSVLTDPVVWSRMVTDVDRFTARLRRYPPSAGECCWSAARLAGAVASWARRMEPEGAGPLSEAALTAAAAAGAGRPAVAAPSRLSVVAFGLAQLRTVDRPTPRDAVLLSAHMVLVAYELSQQFRGHGELHRAEAMAHTAVALNTFVSRLQDKRRAPPDPGARPDPPSRPRRTSVTSTQLVCAAPSRRDGDSHEASP
ncbi:hypothetical protein [Nocardia farcinica]|uniref:hypothetical protein n=1 Tax=Nocardia farcinica TaxID=37329 RepID=UPI00189310C9|nr:hypothetical protein [Nocardia farcinica]